MRILPSLAARRATLFFDKELGKMSLKLILWLDFLPVGILIMSAPANSKTSRKPLLFLLLAILSSLPGCKPSSPGPAAPPEDSPTAASTAEISADFEALKNRCIALLENGAELDKDKEEKQLIEALEGLAKLSKDLPKDPLGFQNRCVGLLFQIRNARVKQSANVSSLESEFLATIEKLKQLTADYPDAWVLESKFYQDKGEMPKAEKALREAISKKEATADTYFQLIELLQVSQSQMDLKDVRKLLESAISKSPSNIALAVAYLDVLAKQQDGEALGPQLQKCREFFQPFASRTGSQLNKLVERMQAALEKQEWKTVQTQATFIRNSLLVEIAYQNDLHLLRPHPLEYVRLSFAGSRSRPADQTTAAIKFEPAGVSFDAQGLTAIATDDVDLDGRSDLVIASGSSLQCWTFEGSVPKAIIQADTTASISGIVLADLDHDYQRRRETLPSSILPTTAPPDAAATTTAGLVDTDVDLIVYGKDGLQLLENKLSEDRAKRDFVPRPVSEEMASLKDIKHVAVIDFDHDSDLDLIVSSEGRGITLWSNRGDWTFADFSGYSTLPDPSKSYDSIIAFDADRDVLTDIFVGSDQVGLPSMLGNNLHGRYHPRSLNWPQELQGTSRAIEAIDANGDACWDLLTCGEKGVRLLTMKSVGRHGWLPADVQKVSDQAAQGLLTCDWNNDGHSDAIAWGSNGAEILAGQANGGLQRSEGSLIGKPILQALAIDIDADNDDDLVTLVSDGQISILRNVDGNKYQQMIVVLRADEDGSQRPRERCNMHGVGSLIELKSNGKYQSQIVRGTRTRFGVGSSTGADVMRVVWTNGTPNNIFKAPGKSTVFDQQQLIGSCPYLYAWNGERFEFFTDCLWAAPIGLQFGPGMLAPTRDWEYLKIDGSALKPKDGKYVLQLTEELWEAAYFDAVELMAVDHPADLEVYSNEKVGPPSVAEFKLFTVRDRIQPKVLNQHGEDLSELTSTRDRRYTKTWTSSFNQGLAQTHWLEIDLNTPNNTSETKSDEKVLFLTGWVFPTCTSLNMALAENPSRPEVQPPSIQVPDAQGNWTEVIPFTGFPGGKTKTIAIDLKGKFMCDDHRVRLVSNMELCWDEVFFSVNQRESDSESYHVQPLKLLGADLHYRGFSQQERRPGNAPNYYDYSRVVKESVWAPMTGAFTRYGQVTELLEKADDLQVVMGGGDEITIEFEAPDKPLPAGWVRDFVIYNVGWDKDADLNTIYGQNVEPLPFRAMKSYPYEPDQQFPTTPAHLEFLRKYQTRQQNPGSFWNQIRDSL